MSINMIAIKIYLDKSLVDNKLDEKSLVKPKLDEKYFDYIIDTLSEPP